MYKSTKINIIKLLFSMTRFAFLVTIVTMTLTGVLMGANVKSQNHMEAKITLATKNTTLAEVLNRIEQQTEITFSFARKVGEMEL